MTDAARSEATEVVRMALACRLPGGPPPPPSGLQLTPDVIYMARFNRVQGLLWGAIGAGLVQGDDDLLDEARQALLDGLMTCLAAEETAVLTLDALSNAGVEARLVKGLAMAHLDYADPAERLFADADVLIRSSDHHRALAALTGEGFRRAHPAVRGWWEQRFGKAIVMYPPFGGELDLHVRITGGYFGEKIDHAALWSSPGESFTLAGRSVTTLDREARLLHACCHTMLGGNSGLRAVHDVAQLVLVSGADWATTADRARRDGHELVVAEALRTAWATFELDRSHPAAHWATSQTADGEQGRALVAYRAAIDGERWRAEGRSTLRALGPIDRARYLAGLALPSRASLRTRQRTLSAHLRRGIGAIRHRR